MSQTMPVKLTLEQVIAHVESRGNLGALRFEPSWQVQSASARLCAVANKCSFHTAIQLCKFSFGQYQIMGSNLYDMGMTSSIAYFLNDYQTQDEMFDEFIKDRHINYTLDQVLNDPECGHSFALHYNGNPLLYLAAIKSAYVELTHA